MSASSAIRAGAAYVELFAKDNKLVAGLRVAAARVKAFAASVSAMGAKIAGLGFGLKAAAVGAGMLFANAGADMLETAQRMGVTVEALSGLKAAAREAGVETEELEQGFARMERTIIQAARGAGAARDSLGRLGLTVADLSGLAPDEQFIKIAEALARVENPANRAALAMEVFGRGGQRLLPLINQGEAGIRRLAGASSGWTTEAAQDAQALRNAYAAFARAGQAVVTTIGGALAPILREDAELFTRALRVVRQFISDHRDLVRWVVYLASGLIGAGVALNIVGRVLGGFGTLVGFVGTAISTVIGILGMLVSAIGLLFTPIGLIVGALAGLTAYFLLATDGGGRAITSLSAGFSGLVSVARTAFAGITDAIAVGDWAGAMEIAWLALKAAWYVGTAALKAAWREFSNWFEEGWDSSTTEIGKILYGAWAYVKNSFLDVVDFLAGLWEQFVAGLQIAFNEFIAGFRRGWAYVRAVTTGGDREAAIQAINEETARANQQISDAVAQNQESRGQARLDRANEAQDTLNAMDQDFEERQRQRRSGIEAANAADLEPARAIQQELDARAADAAWNRALSEGVGRGTGGAGGRPELDLSGLDESRRQIDTAGTFSAFASQGLGVGDHLRNTADNTAEAVRQLRQVNQNLAEGGQFA